MVYFLVTLGLFLISLGLYLGYRKPLKVKKTQIDPALIDRIERLEQVTFKALLEEEKNRENPSQAVEQLEIETSKEDRENGFSNKYKLLERYEREDKSLEEICQLLNMQKGEVFLLKNLYKDY